LSPTIVTSLAIRPERADHPQVVALLDQLDIYLRSLYPVEANHIMEVRALLLPNISLLAAWQGERIVGCGAVRRMPAEAETDGLAYGEIKRMYVAPAERGARIAERLLLALESLLAREGIARALLETGSEQRAAVRLYERTGYRLRPPFGGYPDNGFSLFYEKQLGPA
jgi:putative acetyltransferase